MIIIIIITIYNISSAFDLPGLLLSYSTYDYPGLKCFYFIAIIPTVCPPQIVNVIDINLSHRIASLTDTQYSVYSYPPATTTQTR